MAKSGNRKEFDQLFQLYRRYVYAICYRYCGSQQDALDLTQEVFLKILKNWDSLDRKRDPKPWVRRIAVNTCLNYQRDRKEALSLESETDGTSLSDVIPARENTEGEALGHLEEERISRCIGELPPDIRMALVLRHREGLSYREIAQTMNKPEGTVKTYLHKGRKMLAERLNIEGLGR